MNQCLNCGKDTTNPSYCGRSCAAINTNKKYHKKQLKQKFCTKCGIELIRKTHLDYQRMCPECKVLRAFDDDSTIRDLVYTKHHKSSAFALVRTRARSVAKVLNYTTCIVCGYNKHIEICHRIPISSFNLDTPVKVVNSPDNLLPLCPNCHWEFDHNLMIYPLS